MSSKIVTINRNPFARQDTVRQTIKTKETCTWCGQNCHGHLFQYGFHQDGINTRIGWVKPLFCSKACHDDYQR